MTHKSNGKMCIRDSASNVILLHNHPSGDPQPSKSDFLITERMCVGGEILGIEVLDHIIVGGRTGAFHSMAESGQLSVLKNRGIDPVSYTHLMVLSRKHKKHRSLRLN